MRNKLLATAAILLSATAAHAAPYQDGWFFKPSVGADYQFTELMDDRAGGRTQANSFDTDLNGGNLHVGARVHKNLGLELGYIENLDEKNNGTKIQEHAPYGDVLGYWPVGDKVDVIGALGVSKYHVLANNSNSTKNSEFSWRGRYGVGAQYWLTDHVNLRTIARYEGEDFDSSNSNNSAQITAGVNVQF